jgi:hypothetical protein
MVGSTAHRSEHAKRRAARLLFSTAARSAGPNRGALSL